MHLDVFMKKFHRPTQTISEYDVACRGFAIITGEVFATTIRSFSRFGTHQSDLPHIAEIAQGVPDAKLHALAFPTLRHHTNSCPLSPAMIAKERGNVTPLS